MSHKTHLYKINMNRIVIKQKNKVLQMLYLLQYNHIIKHYKLLFFFIIF